MIETRDAGPATRKGGSRWRFAVSAALAAFSIACAFADTPVPPLRSPVTDLTNTLTRDQVASLEQSLRAFEARKGSQVAVLIVPTTEPETIEQYSIRVADSWQLGRKGVDDGALLLISKNDRALRIEVGRGLEGALPDAIAKRIIRDEVLPHFRAGDFYLGVVSGIDRMTRVIDGEPLPQPSVTERTGERGAAWILPVFFFLTVAAGSLLRSLFGRFVGASLVSVAAGFIVWLFVGMIAAAIFAALVAFAMTIRGGGGGMSRGRGGWGGGSSGWGGGFGGGGGGGGWSGGGGGFSGGGASGRW